MNEEFGTEAAQFPEKEYINGIFLGVQREGRGLLEYQALPSLRDIAHDGVLCTFSK